MDYNLEAICLVAKNIDEMVEFYSGVFGINFESENVEGHSLYTGRFSGLSLTLVPVAISGVKEPKNPTHYDIYVNDLEEGIELVKANGGRTNERLGESDTERAIGIFDPDDNFMVFKQRK
ncbi:MAG: VOC family protein [Planctomycetota bacterium]|jgi:predicted enzyme related to lactoylglutathione lyase